MENNNEFNYDKESIIYNSDGINFVLKNKNKIIKTSLFHKNASDLGNSQIMKEIPMTRSTFYISHFKVFNMLSFNAGGRTSFQML